MGFMSSIIYVGSIVLQPGINSLGYETIAGHTAARKLFSFSMMPLSSMAQAVNTYVAQNRGADNRERVHKGIRYAYLFCFSVTIALIICVTPFAPTLVHLISGSSDPTVLGNGARYLRVAIPFFFALGLVNCSRLALQALGEKILPLLSSFIELFGKDYLRNGIHPALPLQRRNLVRTDHLVLHGCGACDFTVSKSLYEKRESGKLIFK